MKYIRTWGLVVAVALLTVGAADLFAQSFQSPAAWLNRPMLTAPFRNYAVQGQWFNSGAGNSPYLTYPNNLSGGGGYGSPGNVGNYTLTMRNGHGFWSLTPDGRVVYSGPRLDMVDQHFSAMQYDVSADPELSKLGTQWYQVRRPEVKMGNGAAFTGGISETSLGGNWWPGSDLIEEGKKTGGVALVPVHINNFNLGAYPTVDEWPEEIIITKTTNSQGLTITERAMAWSHPDFDDFFIDEYIIENTGDTDGDGERDLPMVPLNDVYLGLEDMFNNSCVGQEAYQRYWHNHIEDAEDDHYAYDGDVKLLYNWDGDHVTINTWDDTGDPYRDAFAWQGSKGTQAESQLNSPAHLGVAVLAYTDDPTSPYRFNARDMAEGYIAPAGEQPFAVRFWQVFGVVGFLQSTGTGKIAMPYQALDPNLGAMTEAEIFSAVLGAGPQFDPSPSRPSSQFSMMLFGPYDLPAGGKAKIVVAYAAGHPGQVLGNTDIWTWARKGNQGELPKGLDALKQNVEAARFAYANTYDIPDAPPDANFRTGSNATANMQVEWSNEVESSAHPDYGSADVAGYRVYRSTIVSDGPWELIVDIPKGTSSLETPTYGVSGSGSNYVIEDKRSVAGFFYHYSVRPYASGHTDWTPGGNPNAPLGLNDLPSHIASRVQVGQEGGWSAKTQRIYAAESPFAVPSSETESLNAEVWVVPTPYYEKGEAHQYPGSEKIRFVGIPSKCRIRIYSVSGELVGDINVNNPGKAESDFDQVTWNNSGQLVSGVYFWVVENLTGSGRALQKGTLMVIR